MTARTIPSDSRHEQIATSRDVDDAILRGLLEIAEGPEAVVFEIKEPPRVVEWLVLPDGDDRLDARKRSGAWADLTERADVGQSSLSRSSSVTGQMSETGCTSAPSMSGGSIARASP